MKVALLSNVTLNGPFFPKFLKQKGNYELYFSDGFDTWKQDLITNKELLSCQCIFLYIHAESLLDLSKDREENKTRLQNSISLIREFVSKTQIPFVVFSLDFQDVNTVVVSSKDTLFYVSYWNELAIENKLGHIDLQILYSNIGKKKFYSNKMWYIGSYPFSMAGEKLLAEECHKVLLSIQGKKKKCLALDLDNTMWGGVIGEDGLDGIELGSAHEGAIYQDFQKVIKQLKEQGTILIVVSKNNHEDAMMGINSSNMILKKDDFSLIYANWDEKTINLKDAAKTLNIGLDSIVFIDDNVVERDKVKANIPDVVVPDFPTNKYDIVDFIKQVARQYFLTYSLTKEDVNKQQQYSQELKRQAEKNKYEDIGSYLDSLDMKMKFYVNSEEHINRIAQLTQKTNQFNLTTKRYTQTEIKEFSDNKNSYVFSAELKDKYGDYGIISVMICNIQQEKLIIDSFLMSCRAMGRNVEFTFLNNILKYLKDKEDFKQIEAEYIKTKKNKPVESFYEDCGFVLASKEEQENSEGIKEIIRKSYILEDLGALSQKDKYIEVEWNE